MTLSTIIHLKRHSIVPIYASKQRYASQSRYDWCVCHAESWGAEVVHVYDDVAIFVVDWTQRQGAIFSFRKDSAKERCGAFDDAKVKLRLRDEIWEFRKDEADLGAGNDEGDAGVEQSDIL